MYGMSLKYLLSNDTCDFSRAQRRWYFDAIFVFGLLGYGARSVVESRLSGSDSVEDSDLIRTVLEGTLACIIYYTVITLVRINNNVRLCSGVERRAAKCGSVTPRGLLASLRNNVPGFEKSELCDSLSDAISMSGSPVVGRQLVALRKRQLMKSKVALRPLSVLAAFAFAIGLFGAVAEVAAELANAFELDGGSLERSRLARVAFQHFVPAVEAGGGVALESIVVATFALLCLKRLATMSEQVSAEHERLCHTFLSQFSTTLDRGDRESGSVGDAADAAVRIAPAQEGVGRARKTIRSPARRPRTSGLSQLTEIL